VVEALEVAEAVVEAQVEEPSLPVPFAFAKFLIAR
jgi:hypothetical protein